jgi:type IV pilus assembly protein PilA
MKTITERAKNKDGFTMIELMTFVGITATLAAMAIPAYQDLTIRSRVTELVKAATVCKTSYTDYYNSQGSAPASAVDAGCSAQGSLNATSPDIANNEIIVMASGNLAHQLGGRIKLALKPDCGAEGCTGAPIKSWNCSSVQGASTDILPKYLPTICR